MLSKLLVRHKLQLLAIVPLLAMAFITVPLVADQAQDARRSSAAASKIQAAARLGSVVQNLERERLLSLAYLALPDGRTGPLAAQSQSVQDEIADARAAQGLRPTPGLSQSLVGLDTLEAVRGQVLLRSIAGDEVNAVFSAAIANLVDGLELAGGADSSYDRPERMLLALLSANERSSNAAATVLAAIATPDPSRAATSMESALAVERVHFGQFEQLATPGQLELFGEAQRSPAAQHVTDLQSSLRADPRAFATSGPVDVLVGQVYGAVDALSSSRRLVQDKIVQDVATAVAGSAGRAVTAATMFGALWVGLVIATLALGVTVGRSVSRPLRRLAVAADRVTELASAELVRVADEDRDMEVGPRLAAVDVRSSDEIGDLAAAINRVQAVAALLLERQVVSRRNIAVMFGNIGRRTQSLVGRQLSLIDSLERNEQDAELLHRLYRLDHLTSRLRRKASSLLVLSGAAEQLSPAAPLPVAELVRAALGETEDFRRVDIAEFPDVLVQPGATSDVGLLLAELLENATSFSPPTTRVEISATITTDGCRVLVVDHGIGMSAQQLGEENERVVRRERLDIAPTDVLGLFVVGRLARRHGIQVALRPTSGGGLTAEVGLPAQLLLSSTITDQPEPAWPEPGPPDETPTQPLPAQDPATATRPTDTHHPSIDEVGAHRVSELTEDFSKIARRALEHLTSVSSRVGTSSGRVGAGSLPFWFGPANQNDTEQQPPPGAAGLRRRVRGASLPAAAASAERYARVHLGRPDEPDSARGFVRDVEAAITRAVNEIRTTEAPAIPKEPDP